MSIHKVIFAGLVASFSLAQANPVVVQKNVQASPIDSVASIVEPISKELVTLTSLPAKSPTLQPANELVVASANSSARTPTVTNAGMARQVQLEVDAPVASTAAAAQPIQENDINMFLLAGLMIGAILLRRRAE